jgi:D-alanyl-D-alanine carboxypeptidase
VVTGYYYKKVVEIASLTKIMTFYATVRVYLQFGLNPDKEIVQIDAKAADISGTSAELYEGDRYSVLQLLYALMLPSGNDAALALAKWGSGLLGEGERGFVGYMNRLAGEIGMRNSTFANPHGLPHAQNGSTAEDVSILVSKCLEFPLFRDVVRCKEFRCWTENEGKKREVVWENTNKLLRRPGFEGVKTGVTATAGPCLATLYNASGRQFIVVLLRTCKLSRRFKETRWILTMCLRRMGSMGGFRECIRELSRNDAELDSDNSEDEQEFNFERNDGGEFEKRRRILLN